jgi:hypothetical protein
MSTSIAAPARIAFGCAFAMVLYELVLTRVLAIVLFADLAHLALGVAMLGLSVGALWAHLRPWPEEEAVDRAAGAVAAQGLASVAVVVVALNLRVIAASDASSWYAREPMRFQLLHPAAFVALMVVASVPAALAGVALGALFQRFREHISTVYAADLVGAGLAAAVFLPALGGFAAPDVAFGCALVAGVGAWAPAARRWAGLAVAVGIIGLSASLSTNVLRVRHAAGWDEANVIRAWWTPVARLALYAGDADHGIAGTYLLLDNGSASLVATEPAQVDELARHGNRSLVYALHEGEQRRVAVMAAGAGPEVAVAQRYGHRDVLAIDLAPEMFQLVRSAYPGQTPYDRPGTRTRALDARTAVRLSASPFGIIQVVQANFLSTTGVINQAWSPQLLYTREAMVDYLRQLEPDGTLAMAHFATGDLRSTALAALRDVGVAAPERSAIVAGGGGGAVLIVKKRPFTAKERAIIDKLMPRGPNAASTEVFDAPVLTDDHPHTDGWLALPAALRRGGAVALIYATLAVQALVTAIAGVVFIAGPWWGRGAPSVPGALPFAVAVGFGYFALEITLLHRLVVYVGHPTWAVTAVVAAMLLGSGIGSATSGLWGPSPRWRFVAVVAVSLLTWAVLLPLVQAWLSVPSFGVRVVFACLSLLPLAVCLGLPMPWALRVFGERDPRVVPWMWAMNGWASAAASVTTLVVVRLSGYTVAFGTGVAAYAVAAGVALWTERRSTR